MIDAVDVWLLSLDRAAREMADRITNLSAEERSRAARYVRVYDRAAFVMVRSTLRGLLGARLGCAASAVRFSYGSHGKPMLADESQVSFNVSHTAGLALIAIAESREVGVDIEAWTASSADDFAYGLLGADERRHVEVTKDPASFYDRWTRKEALIKARGSGLDRALQAVEMTPWCLQHVDGFAIQNIDVGSACSAAVAVADGPCKIPTVIRVHGIEPWMHVSHGCSDTSIPLSTPRLEHEYIP